jgi:hypothetical protein
MLVRLFGLEKREMKFGRRPFVAPKACMKFKDYQTKSFPTPPASGDYRPKAAAALSNVYLNDSLGDCVIAWMAHAIGVFTGNATGTPTTFTDQQIIAEYGAIGGYVAGDPSTDNGCDEGTALDYWLSKGFAGAHQIAGFLAVDPTNAQECRDAIWLFETLMFGVGLPDAWVSPMPESSGFVWDVAGDAVQDNGHCFGSANWSPGSLGVETWGMNGGITDAAVAKYAANAAGGQLFTVITQEGLIRATGRAPNGFDFPQLTADFVGMGGSIKASA